MKLRWQVSLTLAAIAAAATTAGSLAAYQATENQLKAETDIFLQDRLEQASSGRFFFDGNGRFGPIGGDDRFAGPFGPDGEGFGPGFGFVRPDSDTVYLNPDGTVRASLSTVEIAPTAEELGVIATATGTEKRDTTVDGRTYRVLTAPLVEGDASAGGVQLARDITQSEAVLEQLRWRLFIIAILVTAAAASIGWLSSRRLARPLERLRVATSHVTASKNLKTELPVEGKTEVAEVTRSFNEMMAELADSQQRQHQLVLDANHELRTPIATLSANLQLLEGIKPDNPEREDILAEAQRELAELTALADQLAASSTVQYSLTTTASVDLRELIASVVAEFQVKSRRRVSVTFNEADLIYGDADLLGRAILNVLANADKYSPTHHPIDVTLTGTNITIRDRGPGFHPDDTPRVFDPFYRADDARTQPGSGLGLSLTKRIIDSHGGTITANNHRDGGAVVTLSLPFEQPNNDHI